MWDQLCKGAMFPPDSLQAVVVTLGAIYGAITVPFHLFMHSFKLVACFVCACGSSTFFLRMLVSPL